MLNDFSCFHRLTRKIMCHESPCVTASIETSVEILATAKHLAGQPDVQSLIAGVSAIAPLHIQAELEGMDIIGNLLRSVPEVAVFDTGFHR